ncbi:MAG: radical SAM protein [Bacteroidales bacterium]|nr:radical SAM protein [Lentimicrobiaceae bacterium]MDD5695360.1 radical SAM protein [Bacteroidales bacterium]
MGKTVAVIAPMVDVTQYHLNLILRLKGSNRELTLSTLYELMQNGFRYDRLPAIPSKRDMMPAAGFYLTGLLREQGYQTVTTYQCSDAELRRLAAADPLAICLSTTMILSTESLKQLVLEIRRHMPGIPLIAGGVFVWKSYQFFASQREQLSQMDDVNPLLFNVSGTDIPADIYVAAPHGREPLLQILDVLSLGKKTGFFHIPNLALPQSDGTYHFTERKTEQVDYDHDFTRWDLLDDLPEQIPVRTSVGCPFRCRYCDFYQLYPQIFIRSKESLMAELSMIRQRIGNRPFILHPTDDNVFINSRRVKEVTAAFMESGIKQWIGFMRASSVNESNIEDIKRSGLLISLLGIESGDKGQLARMNKSQDMEAVRRGIEILDQNGITALMTFIVGFPGETPETLHQTARFLNDLDIGLASSSYLLFPLIISPFSDLARNEFREQWKIRGYGDRWSHYTMNSTEATNYGYALFKQVTRVPYHYTEERTYQNRVLFDDHQRRRLFHLRQQLTLAFLEQASWKNIHSVLDEMAQVMKMSPMNIPERFQEEVVFAGNMT